MNADLGARLLAAGLVTREELGLALASVPAHGGALAAELVRRGVEEDAIAGFFVADGFGPIVDARELAEGGADELPPQLAVDMLALPLTRNALGLRVAMADPSDVHAVRELTHAAGVAILPTVARIGALVAALFKLFPEETALAGRRPREPEATPIDLVQRRDSSQPPGDSIEESFDSIVPLTRMSHTPRAPIFAPVPAEAAAFGEEPSRKRRDTEDLLGEAAAHARKKKDTDEFGVPEGTRRRRDTADFDGGGQKPRRDTAEFDRPTVKKEVQKEGRRDTAEFEALGPKTETREPDRPRKAVATFTRPETADFVRGAQRDTLVDPIPVADEPGRETMEQVGRLIAEPTREPDDGGWGDLSKPTAEENIARRAARAYSILPQRLPAPTIPPPQTGTDSGAPPAFGDLSTILATIRAAKTRDDVCRYACLGLAPLGRCAVLLVLSKGILKGREVAGGGLPRDAVRNLWIPSTSRSMLQRVVETGEAYLGAHGDSSADKVFRAALGSRGGDVLLMPVVLSGRTVSVLALDEPIADGVVLLERAELLTRATADALRRLIVTAKS
jgi:hypothetical protein